MFPAQTRRHNVNNWTEGTCRLTLILTSLLCVHHLQLAVRLGDGDNLSLGRGSSGGGGSGDAPAKASRGVFSTAVAGRGISRDGGRVDGHGRAVGGVALGLGSHLGVNSDGDGGGSSHMVSKRRAASTRHVPFLVLQSTRGPVKDPRVYNTYVAWGVTVASKKLAQSAWREVMGSRPSRVPVTARAQLSALHPLVRSSTPAMAAATNDRTIAAFIFASVWRMEL